MEKKLKKMCVALSKRSRMLIVIALLLVLTLGSGLWLFRQYAVTSFTSDAFTLYIRPTTTYDALLDTLREHVDRQTFLRFRRLSRLDGYATKMRPGAYRIDASMSAVTVYKHLVNGLQTPVRFTFNNLRTTEQFASRVADQLMMDSTAVMTLLTDTAFLHELGFTRETLPAMLMPDTYEFYWTIEPADFLRRMKREYDHFWDSERTARAAALGLTPLELSTVASIAEEETNDREERGGVGRLYINRLQKGMPLQADPTVKFAIGDFGIRRISGDMLKVDSPYNTYRYAGLPPGPIRIPAKQTLTAILASEPHAYLYMCAKEDFSGRHNFASSFEQHQKNAARYRRALDQRGIK